MGEPTEQDLDAGVKAAIAALRRQAKPKRRRSICNCGKPIQWRSKGRTGICSKCKKEHEHR